MSYFHFIRYVNSLDSTAKSLTIRVKLCHLVEIVSFSSNSITLSVL